MQAVIFSGNGPVAGYERFYYSAYKVWEEVWVDAFEKLGSNTQVFSNDFTRQTFWVGLFNELECVSLWAYREVDLQNHLSIKDSWFKAFDESDLGPFIEKDLKKALICSNVTLSFNYRKTKTEVPYPYLNGQIGSLMCLEYGLDVMFGCTNNNKSVDKMGKACGSIDLKKNVDMYNVKADLIYFTPESIVSQVPHFSDEAKKLYEEATILISKGTHNEIRQTA